MWSPKLQCPVCRISFGVSLSKGIKLPQTVCRVCGFRVVPMDGTYDGRVSKNHPLDFSVQWILWDKGKLGDSRFTYGQLPTQAFDLLLQALNLNAEILKQFTLLEVGYGNGRLLQEIQKHCSAAFGIDLCLPAASSSLKPNTIIQGDLFAIPFEPGQFDIVICKGTIQHTPRPKQAFRCVADQVGPNGLLYISTYEKNMKKSLMLRTILPWTWRYPVFVRLLISRILGMARALLHAVRAGDISLKTITKMYRTSYKLAVFDVISPRWSHTLAPDQVVSWFDECGFRARRVGQGIYVGRKQPKDYPVQEDRKRVREGA